MFDDGLAHAVTNLGAQHLFVKCEGLCRASSELLSILYCARYDIVRGSNFVDQSYGQGLMDFDGLT